MDFGHPDGIYRISRNDGQTAGYSADGCFVCLQGGNGLHCRRVHQICAEYRISPLDDSDSGDEGTLEEGEEKEHLLQEPASRHSIPFSYTEDIRKGVVRMATHGFGPNPVEEPELWFGREFQHCIPTKKGSPLHKANAVQAAPLPKPEGCIQCALFRPQPWDQCDSFRKKYEFYHSVGLNEERFMEVNTFRSAGYTFSTGHYYRVANNDGSCCYIYGKSTSLAEFFGGTQRRVATLCPKSKTFEGDAVASDLPDTAKSGGKKSVDIGKITMLIVIMMASMFMF
ncbi:hypothetical protein PSENEW3_00004794 [Picochlorum sp. SENEW3]|nr:hypothetical protein PSENEW3_00004794 [Picochlorum sp. SENEW3]